MDPKKPIISRDLADLMRPGFMVEVDPADVDQLGLAEETALDEAAALPQLNSVFS